MTEGDDILQDPGICTRTSLIQLGYGFWTILTTVGVGLAFGFSAVAIPQLREPESPIHPTTNEESWIASVLTLASPLGCLLSGFLIDRVGRKKTLLLCQVPMCAGWLAIACAGSTNHMIIGRIIMGFGCGMSTVPPRVYMSEFSLPNIRGVIGALPNLAMGLGITVEAYLGTLQSWRVLSWIGVVYCSMLCVLNLRLPESPYFLLLKGLIGEAKVSLKRFRGSNYNVDKEMADMVEYKEENNIRSLKILQMIPALFQRAACRPFWIINIYVLITQLSGISVTTFYAVEILTEAKTSTDAATGNIILGVSRMLGGLLCSILLFSTGRRKMSFISGFGAGSSYIMMGLYAKHYPQRHIFPMICATSYIVFASLGYYTIPLLLIGEMFPLQVRGFLGGVTVSLTYLMMFLSNKFYPSLKLTFGFPNIILFYGSTALCGVFFLFLVLPETKLLTLTEIEEYFNGRLTTPVSHKQLMSLQRLQRTTSTLGRSSSTNSSRSRSS